MAEVGINFIFNGINNSPIDFSGFKDKYGIGIVTRNYVVDPITFKESIEHNIYLVNYLNQKNLEKNGETIYLRIHLESDKKHFTKPGNTNAIICIQKHSAFGYLDYDKVQLALSLYGIIGHYKSVGNNCEETKNQ